jgi:hypothetical protein
MKEAIEFHLEGLKEDRIPIPEPTILARSVEVAVYCRHLLGFGNMHMAQF